MDLNVPFSLILKSILKACVVAALAFPFTVSVWAVDPRQEPIPTLDLDDTSKALVVRADFVRNPDGTQVSLHSAKVVLGHPARNVGDPPHLRIQLLDKARRVLESYNAWDPLWAFVVERERSADTEFPTIREKRISLNRAQAQFVVPFYPNLKTMEVFDIRQKKEKLIAVDLEPAIRLFCQKNASDPDCKQLAGTPSGATETVSGGGCSLFRT